MIVDPERMHCEQCRKMIEADEYTMNWGSCSECFNAHYEKYMELNGLGPEDVEWDI